jgi:hypothetical protein
MYRNSTISTLVSASWRILAKVIVYFDKAKGYLLHERELSNLQLGPA